MKVKNILLKTLFPIENNKLIFTWHASRDNLALYNEMQDISIASFQKNLLGDWHLMDIRAPAQPNLQEAFIYTMNLTKKIYLENYPCRILYTDPDTICMRPLDIWGAFPEFRLFDQMDQNVQPLSRRTEGYWRCHVRYYSENINKKFWNKMHRLMSNWYFKQYAYEQEVYAKLMWSQDLDLSIKQDYVQFDWPVNFKEKITSLDQLPEHCIGHFAASGNVPLCLETMKNVWGIVNQRDKESSDL
jgi:hypothetical protein